MHLRYPIRHRNRWRCTNLLERSLGEVNRRTKVIGRFPGEDSCLTLVWAVLDLFFTHDSNGIRFTDLDRQHLYRIKYQAAESGPLCNHAMGYLFESGWAPPGSRDPGDGGDRFGSVGRGHPGRGLTIRLR